MCDFYLKHLKGFYPSVFSSYSFRLRLLGLRRFEYLENEIFHDLSM